MGLRRNPQHDPQDGHDHLGYLNNPVDGDDLAMDAQMLNRARAAWKGYQALIDYARYAGKEEFHYKDIFENMMKKAKRYGFSSAGQKKFWRDMLLRMERYVERESAPSQSAPSQPAQRSRQRSYTGRGSCDTVSPRESLYSTTWCKVCSIKIKKGENIVPWNGSSAGIWVHDDCCDSPILAPFGSTCRACGENVAKGDSQEVWKDKKSQIWVHEECYETDIGAKSVTSCLVCRNEIEIDDSIAPWAETKNALGKLLWVHEECEGGKIAVDIPEKFRNFDPSTYQSAIKEEYLETDSHLIIDAKAGSGKTTTLEWLVYTTHSHPSKNILMMAFNKSIANELNGRMSHIPRVAASTLNSFGNSLVGKAYKWPKKLDAKKISILAQVQFPFKKKDQDKINLVGHAFDERVDRNRKIVDCLQKIIDKVKSNLATPDQYEEIISHYNIKNYHELDDEGQQLVLDTIPELLEENIRVAEEFIDFNDQIFLPIISAYQKKTGEQVLSDTAMGLLKKVRFPRGKSQIDVLFVDESQDLNRCQQELALLAIGDKGRLICVGDPKQSIYAFSGADSSSMDRMLHLLSETNRGCRKMDLSVTFRCPRAVVQEAQCILQTVVGDGSEPPMPVLGPDETTILPAPGAPEGVVREMFEDEAMDNITVEDDAVMRGDHVPTMILCRANAPLFGAALRLLSRGIPVKVIGRDIGKSLKKYIDGINNKIKPKNNESIEKFARALQVRLDNIREHERKLIKANEFDPENEESPYSTEKDQIAAIYMLACGGDPNSPCAEGEGLNLPNSVTGLKEGIDNLFNGGSCPDNTRHPVGVEDDFCPICANNQYDASGTLLVEGHSVPVIKRPGVIFSTVHKSKGLEALKIYILAPEKLGRLFPDATAEDQRQEIHLWYVAVTRTKFTREDSDSGVLTYLIDEESDHPSRLCIQDEHEHDRRPPSRPPARVQHDPEPEFDPPFEPDEGPDEPRYEQEPEAPGSTQFVTIEKLNDMSLPTMPKTGKRGSFTEPTMAIWAEMRNLYADLGIPAKLVRFQRWNQYALLVNGVAISSSTLDVRGGSRGKRKAIRVLTYNERGIPMARSGKTIRRTGGWEGRVLERLNGILRTKSPTPNDMDKFDDLQDHGPARRRRNPYTYRYNPNYLYD